MPKNFSRYGELREHHSKNNMPQLISREKAIAQIEKQIKPGECLACALLSQQKNPVIHSGKFTTVLLTLFPRNWGQVMILLNSHKLSFSELTDEEWAELNKNLRKAAMAVEKTLNPLRVFVAGTGSVKNHLITCPHLHFNIVPVYNAEEKSSEIFTWENGVYEGTETEWKELHQKLRAAFSST